MRSNAIFIAIAWIISVIAFLVYIFADPLVEESFVSQVALLVAIFLPIGSVIFLLFSYINNKLLSLEGSDKEERKAKESNKAQGVQANETLTQSLITDFHRTPKFILISSITWIVGVLCWLLYFQWEADEQLAYFASWIIVPAICLPLFVPFYGSILIFSRVKRMLKARKLKALNELKYGKGLRKTYKY